MNEPTNTDRAAWAKTALAVFTVRTYGGRHPDALHRDDLETAVYDLICDLLHFAHQHGFDTAQIIRDALFHFEAEQREEAQNA